MALWKWKRSFLPPRKRFRMMYEKEIAKRDSMPRCYMVKKDPSPLEGTPPCSPTEASVAPPCYTPHDPSADESPPAQSTPFHHVGTQYEEPRNGDYADNDNDNTDLNNEYIQACGGATFVPVVGATTDLRYDHEEPRNGIYTVLRAARFTDPHLSQLVAEPRLSDYSDHEIKYEYAIEHPDICQIDYSDPRHIQYGEPRSGDFAEPRTVRYLERDLSSYGEPLAAEYAEPRMEDCSTQCSAEFDESRSADYAEPSQYSEHHAAQGVETPTEFAVLQRIDNAPREHSAADTEAAHDLLSLAAGVPPLPPAAILTVLRAPEAVSLPVYTYTLQPTNVYILSDEKTEPNMYAATLQALGSVQQLEYTTASQPQINATYITYQEPILPQQAVEFQQLYATSEAQSQTIVAAGPMTEVLPLSMPVSVIEATPTAQLSMNMPISVQVPVIEPVPQSQQQCRAEPVQQTHQQCQPMPVPLLQQQFQLEPMSQPQQKSKIEPVPQSQQQCKTELAIKPMEQCKADPLPQSLQQCKNELVPHSQQQYKTEFVPKSLPQCKNETVQKPPRHCKPKPASAACSSDSEPEEPLRPSVTEKKNKYDCSECGKRYATSSNLSRHKQTHRSLDSQAAKRCDQCGKVYVSMPALAMHVLTHRMQHVCGVCGKQFSRPWLLRGHLRSHTGEKPYDCPSCGKSFADRSNLRAHLQTHSGDKKWECVRCNKTFALKSYLNKHQEAACSQDEDQ